MIDTMTLRQILKQSDTFTCIIFIYIYVIIGEKRHFGNYPTTQDERITHKETQSRH